jgi:hypothetical protein
MNGSQNLATTASVHFPSSSFYGVLAKWLELTLSFVMSVRVSIGMEELGSDWADFH